MKKILLIQPWNYHDEGVKYRDFSQEWRNGPYSLLCLVTALKQENIPVRLVDLQPVLVKSGGEIDNTLNHLENELVDFIPDVIGISFFSYQYLETEKIVKFCRKICKQTGINPLFIAGGIHASVKPKETIKQLGFDYAFVGEADQGIIEIAKSDSIESVQGIVSSNGLITRGVPVTNLSDLPFPDWQLCDVSFYTAPSFAKTSTRAVRTVDMLMGRGCAYRCSFCAYSTLSNVRYYSAEYLIQQMINLKNTLHIDSIYFIDSSIGNNRNLLVELCNSIIATKLNNEIEWYANIRANQVDEYLLLLMWEAGCRFLFYGFESGSQRILDLMNKKCTVEQNIVAAQLHNKHRFPYHASFILGYPTETEEDIMLTQGFINEVTPYRSGINWYVPLPGSDDYKKLIDSECLELTDPHEWRKIGEVLTTGKVYASIDANHFRQLFTATCNQANVLNTKHQGSPWNGPSLSRKDHMSIHATASLENKLREKWQEIPATRQDRAFSSDLLNWPDEQLLDYWEECRRQTTTPEVRGWFQDLYKDDFWGLDVADVGPGVGVDGIYFAQRGANVTFVDIVEDNLNLLKRICSLKGIKADFYFIDDFFSYHFKKNFDAFLFIGSMINAPFEFTQHQLKSMLAFLRPGGKALMLGYPKERYAQLGAKSCEEFGKMTDGERTPWCEWYDAEKVKLLFGDSFQLNWSRNFGQDNIEFNWFDLTKLAEPAQQTEASAKNLPVPQYGIDIPLVHVFDIHTALGFTDPIDYPKSSITKKFSQWKMEVDDAPIFRYIYRNVRPHRHLEFGTWQGKGTTYCLEESPATVWTINMPFGEGSYGFYEHELPDAHAWARKVGIAESASYSSDAIGFIGKTYLEQNLGNRVCQIYCDSQEWDSSNYPEGFFDTILVDGGHFANVVASDTRKALPLLRSGGIIMWHDFCATDYQRFEACKGVMEGIASEWNFINEHMAKLFWIYPSMILIGIKK